MDIVRQVAWEVFYTLFWRSPFCYVTWVSLIILAIGARTEYVKYGGGLKGTRLAGWYAIKNFPRTMNEVLRWIAMQIILIAGLVSRTDVLGMLPRFVRTWLGHGPIETRTVYKDRIVERVKWKRPPIKWRLTKSIALILTGFALTRVYDHWTIVGPWIYRWF